MTFLAIFLPVLAFLMMGRLISAILALVLMCTIAGWPVASIWAVAVVADRNANKRTDKLIKAIKNKK